MCETIVAFFTDKKSETPPVSKHSYLCSEHVSEECFKRPMGGRVHLKRGSLPTRFSFTSKAKPKLLLIAHHRSALAQSQINRRPNLTLLKSHLNKQLFFPSQESEMPSMTTAKTEVVKSKEELLMEQFKAKEEEVRRLNELLETQRKELEDELTEKMKQLEQEREFSKEMENMFQKSLFYINNIKGNPKLLKFYTGFPNYEIFCMVLSFL